MMLLLPALACERGEPCAGCREAPQPRHLQLTLASGMPETRSDGSSWAESRLAQCRLYVFSRSGYLVNCYDSSDGRFDLFLTDETYDFVAVANKDGLPAFDVDKAGLLDTETTLAENGAGSFVMVGRLDEHRIDGDEKITVEMQRLVAKISYDIHTAFAGWLAAEPFAVEAVFLTNVTGVNRLSLADSLPASQSLWYNRMDWEDNPDAPAALLQEGPSFYAYPNVSPDNHDKTAWGSRCTRFVVKASLAGQTTYYPVTLEKVRANHHYHIDLTVANFGVEHPEDRPDDYGSFAAFISVEPWKEGVSLRGDF